MSVNIVVPELGESVVEARVLRWVKHEGDAVAAGDTLVELETEKVNLEVTAERGGVLARILHREGEDVKIGDALGVIEERVPQEESGQAPASASHAVKAQPASQAEQATARTAEPKRDGQEESRVTPVARRYAEQFGIDVSQVPASAADGRVTRQDVQDYVERQKQAPAPTPPPAPAASPSAALPAQPPVAERAPAARAAPRREERVRMSKRRQTIARRLLEAQQQAAMLTTFNEINLLAVIELRKKYRETFKTRYGVGLGFTSFFVKAAIGALRAFPQLNAQIDGDEIVLHRYYDIGIAVGAAEGLVVPVLRDVDRLSFVEIERAIGEFSNKAQNGTLSLEDLRGGTFTITNGGVFGSLLSTPILNPPQVGILGLHKIEERPVAENGQVVVRPMMYVALTYDHRIVDGREAVQFLVRIKELIEDPAALLLEG